MTATPKPGSRAQREAVREQMLAVGGRPADIVAEMRTRWRLRPREAWRHAHGWTLQQLADRVDAAAAALPGVALATDASLIGKWEKWPCGGRRPTVRALTLLAHVFGCHADDLLDLDDRQQMPEDELLLLTRPQPPAESPPPAPHPPGETVPDVTGAAMTQQAAAESAAWAQWAETSNVGDLALEQLLADTRDLALAYLSENPLVVFAKTRALRDRVFALLEGRQYPRQSADLYATAGYLCALLAWISSDLGRLRDADTQGRTAWLCAELSGHNDLRAWVLSTRSKIAFWDGRLRDAVGFARRGADYHPRGTAGILLACQEADAWSTLGAATEARAALERAADVRDQQSGMDEIGGLFTCLDFRRGNYNAAVLARIGDPAAALAASRAALADCHGQPYGTIAQVHISQGFAHLALGEPDGTLDALRPVLALPPERRLDTVNRRLTELARSVAGSPLGASGPGRALQTDIEAWHLHALPRTLALEPGPDTA
ncbi:helix-turn-helix transcriptional regulator [Nonomuraea sp. NPDC050310]|uniref:helix-turn-helix domain-containing protein n=1 Tax=Nonomuraea sp. NPDC050310 TaxID=3154935 RepID=UPI0033EDF3A0